MTCGFFKIYFSEKINISMNWLYTCNYSFKVFDTSRNTIKLLIQVKSYTLKSVLVHVYLYSFLSRPKSTLSYFASITIVSDLGFISKVIITTDFKHFYLIRLLGGYNTVPPPKKKQNKSNIALYSIWLSFIFLIAWFIHCLLFRVLSR